MIEMGIGIATRIETEIVIAIAHTKARGPLLLLFFFSGFAAPLAVIIHLLKSQSRISAVGI